MAACLGHLRWLVDLALPADATGCRSGERRQLLARIGLEAVATVEGEAAEVHGEGRAGVHPLGGTQFTFARVHVRVHDGDHLSRVCLWLGVQAALR